MTTFQDLERLTLVYPPVLEDALLELLLSQVPALPGFTVLAGEGHGADFARASLREQVRGRVARRLLLMVLPRERSRELLDVLRTALPSPQVVWWTEPVSAFGRLA